MASVSAMLRNSVSKNPTASRCRRQSARHGAEVEEFEDGLDSPWPMLHGATIDAGGDHRIAMASPSRAPRDRRHPHPRRRIRSNFIPEFFDLLDRVVER